MMSFKFSTFLLAILTHIIISFKNSIAPKAILKGIWVSGFTSTLPSRILRAFTGYTHTFHRAINSLPSLRAESFATYFTNFFFIKFPIRIIYSVSSFGKYLSKIDMKTFATTVLSFVRRITIYLFTTDKTMRNNRTVPFMTQSRFICSGIAGTTTIDTFSSFAFEDFATVFTNLFHYNHYRGFDNECQIYFNKEIN